MTKYTSNNSKQMRLFMELSALIVIAFVVFGYYYKEIDWFYVILFIAYPVFILSTTAREFQVTDNNKLKIISYVNCISKPTIIEIDKIVALKKIKNDRLRIDHKKGFHILRLKEPDRSLLADELKKRNPTIVLDQLQ